IRVIRGQILVSSEKRFLTEDTRIYREWPVYDCEDAVSGAAYPGRPRTRECTFWKDVDRARAGSVVRGSVPAPATLARKLVFLVRPRSLDTSLDDVVNRNSESGDE